MQIGIIHIQPEVKGDILDLCGHLNGECKTEKKSFRGLEIDGINDRRVVYQNDLSL